MKKSFLALGVLLAAGSVPAARLDGVAAIVDRETITVGDVSDEMRRRRHESFDDALNSLIDRKLILRAAADKKMEMQEWVVDNRVREIVHDNFGDDRNKLDAELRRERVSMADWRKSIREDMIVNGMRWQMVDKNITPTPGQMRREFADHPERYMKNASVSVRVILLRPSSDDGAASVTTRAEDILGRLGEGADFAELAVKNSADSHAKEGGLWKDVDPREAFRPEIADAIGELKPGQYSRLIMLNGWGFIVKKESEVASAKLTFAEAYEDIVYNVRRETGRKAYQDWVGRLRSEATVKVFPAPDGAK